MLEIKTISTFKWSDYIRNLLSSNRFERQKAIFLRRNNERYFNSYEKHESKRKAN